MEERTKEDSAEGFRDLAKGKEFVEEAKQSVDSRQCQETKGIDSSEWFRVCSCASHFRSGV
jgi:hypothetical protein